MIELPQHFQEHPRLVIFLDFRHLRKSSAVVPHGVIAGRGLELARIAQHEAAVFGIAPLLVAGQALLRGHFHPDPVVEIGDGGLAGRRLRCWVAGADGRDGQGGHDSNDEQIFREHVPAIPLSRLSQTSIGFYINVCPRWNKSQPQSNGRQAAK